MKRTTNESSVKMSRYLLLAVLMMMIAFVAATTSTLKEGEPVFSEIEISSTLETPAGALALSSSQPVQTTSTTTVIQANSTITYLYNGQRVSSKSIPAYSWHYYYVYVSANMKLKIDYYKSGSNMLELYMRETYTPTTGSYDQKAYFYSYTQTLTKTAKSYGNYVYIAVRNTDNYFANMYTLSVNMEAVQDPCKICPTPSPTYYYRDNTSSMIPLFVLFPLVSLILLITVIVQARRINRLTQRMTALERSVNPQEHLQVVPTPVQHVSTNMDAVPLVSANTLEQQHELQEQQHVDTTQPQTATMTQPMFYPVTMQNNTYMPQPFMMPQVGAMPYPVRVYAMPPQFQQPQQPQPQQPQQQPMSDNSKQ